MAENGKNPPEQTLRCGDVELALWRRDGEFGPMYSASFSQKYKEGDKQKRTPYLNGSNLQDAGRLIPEAIEYISEKKREYKAAHPEQKETDQDGDYSEMDL